MSESYKSEALELVLPSDDILSSVAEEVLPDQIASAEIQTIIEKMLQTAEGNQGDATHKTMVGLAAPQVGIAKRIIIVGTDAKGNGEIPHLEVFINPKIVKYSDIQEEGREGCYSTGKIAGIVERPKRITVRAYDRYGHPVEGNYAGFPARVMQHEIDHLDGIRFPDKIDNDRHLHWVEPEVFGEYRTHWRNWDVYCPRSTWEAMKLGTDKN